MNHLHVHVERFADIHQVVSSQEAGDVEVGQSTEQKVHHTLSPDEHIFHTAQPFRDQKRHQAVHVHSNCHQTENRLKNTTTAITSMIPNSPIFIEKSEKEPRKTKSFSKAMFVSNEFSKILPQNLANYRNFKYEMFFWPKVFMLNKLVHKFENLRNLESRSAEFQFLGVHYMDLNRFLDPAKAEHSYQKR